MQLTPTPRSLPEWLKQALEKNQHDDLRLFVDSQRFHDDVHGQIYLNALERDIVDAPEFQRLFRLGQLGFVDHVYQSANHTRGAHCIAACALSKHLVDLLNANTLRTSAERRSQAGREIQEAATKTNRRSRAQDGLEGSPLGEAARQLPTDAGSTVVPQVSVASAVVISLGALLHDLPHGPFSHDIERKTHWLVKPYGEAKLPSHYGPYDKHDDFSRNPALYSFLLLPSRSVLARILRAYSPLFWRLMQVEVAAEGGCQELAEFVSAVRVVATNGGWPDFEHQILPSLMFHLLAFESLEDATRPTLNVATDMASPRTTADWGLGKTPAAHGALHRSWYRPYRHDVIGDTVSADLIDYLLRDIRRLGLRRKPDLRILDFYVLTPFDSPSLPDDGLGNWVPWHRCAVDLNDYKRGTLRLDLVNDLLRLLDLRFEIHEKAVYHRVVQASIAMLSRAIFFLPERPTVGDAYGVLEGSPALAGDEAFLLKLLEMSKGRTEAGLASRLAERRVYRPLMVIPGDRLRAWLVGLGTGRHDGDVEPDLRLCAAMLDCTYYAPFLCYLSRAIEMLLKHAYVTVAELRAEMLAIAHRSGSEIDEAMRVHSERVILWALPYKQLYKDLAVVVRAQFMAGTRHEDLVTQLDNLEEAWIAKNRPDDLSSLVRRVSHGMTDADSKYASLWKMYVFLSDGLFSTGVLAKFGGSASCAGSGGVNVHGGCLRNAQGLVLEGLRAIWIHWHRRRAEGEVVDLQTECSPEEFALLLKMLGATNAELELNDHYRSDARKLSAVAVDQYLHHSGSSLYEVHEDARCRDMRFKFPRVVRKGDLSSLVEDLPLEAERKRQVRDLMELVKGAEWTEEEASELASHLGRASIKFVDEIVTEAKAARGAISLPKLRRLWRQSGEGAVARDAGSE